MQYELGFSNIHVTAFCTNHKDKIQCLMPEDYWQESGSTIDLFHSGREHGLTVPHDRIYALLGLPIIANQPGFKVIPNYRNPFQEVCYDFALSYLTAYKDLDILLYIAHSCPQIPPIFPSWIPIWLPEDFARQEVEGMYARRSPISTLLSPPIPLEGKLQVQ